MNIFIILLGAVILLGSSFANSDSFFRDYLAPGNTTSIKGIFVILIIFSHFSQYVTLKGSYDEAYVILQNHLNQMVVAMFLFYSGFGIMESYRKKGYAYIHAFPVKRILTVFVNMAVAIGLYLLVNLAIGKTYDPGTILLSLIGWSNVGNSSWYMFVIFFLYFATWLCFTVVRRMDSGKSAWAGTVLLSLATIAFVYWQMSIDRPRYSYNTAILYAAGMWYSLLKQVIDRYVMHNSLTYSLSCLLVGGMYYLSFRHRWDSIEIYTIWALAFTAAVLLLTMKYRIGNPILDWFGNNIFGVYILQRIPMMLLGRLSMFSSHKYVYLVFVFLCLVPMVIVFNQITDHINRRISAMFIR